MILSVFALVLSICALLFCVWLYLDLLKKPYVTDLRKEFESYSEDVKVTYARKTKEIETEWADMYSKFMRLAGRIDKTRGLEQAAVPSPEPVATKRSDLLRRHRGGAINE